MYKTISYWTAPQPQDVAAFEEFYQQVHGPRPCISRPIYAANGVAFTAPAGPQSLRGPTRPFGGLGCFQRISQVVGGGPAGEEAQGVVVG